MINKIFYLLLILYINEVSLLDPCGLHYTCNECIQDENNCFWCASNNYNGTNRCRSVNSDQKWCPDNSLQNPVNYMVKSQDNDFSSESGTVTQIKPQRYQMKLRPGQPMDFSFSFKRARDYPVDLYFIFDASYTMNPIKNYVAQSSKKIIETVKNMTNNVAVGMGSFVDKNIYPFTLNVADKLAYSFRHRLSFTKDYEVFQKAVAAIPVGENRDDPEAGLDALAQAIACKEHIGWRNESRKIIVLLTDGPYHVAGDGKSAGIIEPYDGKCYTDNGVYTKELEMDYPSVSVINELAKQNDISVIFAVTFYYYAMYLNLANSISGANAFSFSVDKSDEIVTKFNQIYKKITQDMKLKLNMRRGRLDNFDISFNPDCTQKNDNCNVSNEEEHNFLVTMKLKKYDGNNDALLDLSIEGINEKLTLEIDVLKDCECASKAEITSTYCNGEKRECGACICSEKKFGETCMCTKTNANSTCIGEGMTKPCNGKGKCICDVCECYEGFNGRYCECNNCPRDVLGFICGGHGVCQCDGTCKCAEGYSGKDCMCYTSVQYCTGSNGRICNNRGICKCGSCNCDVIADWDSRNYQSTMCVVTPCRGSECHELQCTKLNNCVLSRMNDSPNCPCESAKYELLDKLPEDIANSTDWNVCPKLSVTAGCYTNYAYKYDEDQYRILVKVEREKKCTEIPNI